MSQSGTYQHVNPFNVSESVRLGPAPPIRGLEEIADVPDNSNLSNNDGIDDLRMQELLWSMVNGYYESEASQGTNPVQSGPENVDVNAGGQEQVGAGTMHAPPLVPGVEQTRLHDSGTNATLAQHSYEQTQLQDDGLDAALAQDDNDSAVNGMSSFQYPDPTNLGHGPSPFGNFTPVGGLANTSAWQEGLDWGSVEDFEFEL